MEPETIIVLIVFAFIAYAVYLVWIQIKGWNEFKERRKQQGLAKAIQEGRKPYGKPMGHAYGSAYLMTPNQIAENTLGFKPKDFAERNKTGDLGFLFFGEMNIWPKGHKEPSEVAYPALEGPGHAITIAPTRSGKGAGAVIPNLLIYSGSVIVNDIKGENYAVTSRYRRLVGQDVYKLAPFDDETAHWNPFDVLARSEDPWDDARHMAELLITDEPGKDEFWSNGARNLLTGLILYVSDTAVPESRSLSHLRDLLTQDQEDFDLTLGQMGTSENKIIARAANVFQRADAKVQSGILSTLDSELAFLDSERLARCTQNSDFSFEDLKKENISIYLIMPPERLRTYAPFMRLFMGIAALELKRTKDKPESPVLLMMDEFPALGRMKVIEHEISYLAGYEVRLWLFAQDLKQLVSIYGQNAQSIIANCRVKQFFGVADYETAQLVSHMCGNTTVPNISVSSSTGVDIMNTTESIGDRSRPLFDPNEVMNLPNNKQLLFFQGYPPILAIKLNYYEAVAIFTHKGENLYDENPFHT